MSRGFTKNKKFHPINSNKKGVRMKKGKSIRPKFELKLPERKETFAQINEDINRDNNLRTTLIEKNDEIADKIESSPQSEFTESRKDQFKKNSKIIKDLNSEIKRSIGKLTKEEKERLPDDIKNLRRFL